jgi:hypothetical protein
MALRVRGCSSPCVATMLTSLLQFWWICYMAYSLTMIGAKVSVGLSLLRITPITRQKSRLIVHVVVYTSIVTGLAFGLLTTFECQPIDYFWTRAIGATGKCVSMDVIIAFTYVMSALYAACDFSFAIFPVFLIKDLNMSRGSKIALIPILSIACMYVLSTRPYCIAVANNEQCQCSSYRSLSVRPNVQRSRIPVRYRTHRHLVGS